MKNAFCFSIIFLVLISWMQKNGDTLINRSRASGTLQKSYLALGDSYTIGESVEETESFPAQTAKILKEQGMNISSPAIIAVTGWTTTDLLNALQNHPPPQKNYSFVTLLIGVNNQYRGETLEKYTTEFAELLNESISYADNKKDHVFVISIPDYSVTPFANGSDTARIYKEIDDFNAVNKSISLNSGVPYLDITPISREAKNEKLLIGGDGLHPSAIQYKIWSESLAPMILKQLWQVENATR
ncbi:MAG: SGNH/GDSL hydrolase family protein [Ginsengibacter sp.]